MRLYKIKNSYLFKSDKPNGTHTYAVYKDPKTKEIRAVALTHLYVKDEKRFKQVKKGNIAVVKFKEFDVPSGVQNYYFSSNLEGKKIDLKDKKNVFKFSNKSLQKDQAEHIKKFAKNNYKETYGNKKKNSHK